MGNTWKVVVLGAMLVGCGDDAVTGIDPDTAPRVAIDRFGEFGTVHRRDANPSLPAAGEPIDFDASFETQSLGPDGQVVRYYDFDAQNREPMVAYQLWHRGGEPVQGQPWIVTAVPGEAGYSDFWQPHRVWVEADYVANTITSAAEIADLGLEVETVGELRNRPLVPEGSTAADRFGGGDPNVHLSWYDGQVAPYLIFEEAPLAPLADGIFAGQVPVSYIYVTFNINAGEDGGGPPSGFKTEPGTVQTHNVIATIPGDATYSPLWMVNIYDNAEFDQVSDWASALDSTLVATGPREVNCPVTYVE